MNMASTLKVPLVAIIENNLYGMSVPFSGSEVEGTLKASNITDIAWRCYAYNVPAMIVDGQDVIAVYLAVKSAVKWARGRNTDDHRRMPRPIAGMATAEATRGIYRTKDEEKAWRQRDPIIVLRGKLLADSLCTEQQLDAIKDKAFNTIEISTKFGHRQPLAKSR